MIFLQTTGISLLILHSLWYFLLFVCIFVWFPLLKPLVVFRLPMEGSGQNGNLTVWNEVFWNLISCVSYNPWLSSLQFSWRCCRETLMWRMSWMVTSINSWLGVIFVVVSVKPVNLLCCCDQFPKFVINHIGFRFDVRCKAGLSHSFMLVAA